MSAPPQYEVGKWYRYRGSHWLVVLENSRDRFIRSQQRGNEGDVESAVWAHWLERNGTWSTPMWLREYQVSPHPDPEGILLSLMKALTAGRVDND